MAGTTYNTLSLPAEEPRQEQSSRKVAIVAAVVVACCAMFFAGRVQARPVDYTHEEVMNVGRICAEGEYIGKCIECQTCAEYEYENGGCSFFKDTFCSYCEPIDNCQRENIVCTDRVDQTCTKCNCDDPITSWDDITKEYNAIRQLGLDTTYSCYLGQQCRPCTVCEKGTFQTGACDPASGRDTECTRCTKCEQDEYVSEPCTYQTDTVCETCSDCGFEKTVNEPCTGRDFMIEGQDTPYFTLTQGYDTVCMDCATCDDVSFVSKACTPVEDTVCTTCKLCDEDYYITEECRPSSGPTEEGLNRECGECDLPMLDPLESGAYLTAVCENIDYTDFQYNDCTLCVFGEYIQKDCEFGGRHAIGSDRICDDCAPVAGCDDDMIQCTILGDSECTRCQEGGYEGKFGDEHFGKFDSCCNDGALGRNCGWEKINAGCDSKGQSYRERSAKRGGFFAEGETASDFIMWCKTLCDAFPDCTAFEVEDCIADESCEVKPATLCGLKDHVESEEEGGFQFGDGAETHTCWTKPQV